MPVSSLSVLYLVFLKRAVSLSLWCYQACGINERNRQPLSPTGTYRLPLTNPPTNQVNRYMMNGGQQIVGGLLAYCFSLIGNDKVIMSWQALFMTYGCISVLWGLFVLLYMPDSPMRAKCFNEEEKHLMVERVRSNQTGLQNRQFRAYQMWEAFRDPQTWCYCGIQVFTTLPTSGLGAFANIIISGFHFTVLETQLLAMVLGFYIIIVLLSSSWVVSKTHQNLLVMLGFIIP